MIVALIILYPKSVVGIGIIGGTAFFLLLGSGYISRQVSAVSGRINSQQQVNERIIVMDAMVQMIQKKPIVGWGFDTLNQNLQKHYRPVRNIFVLPRALVTSHNTFLTIFTELGLIGIALYLTPVIYWAKLTIQNWRMLPAVGFKSRAYLIVIWLGVLTSFEISNFIDMRFFPLGITLWWMGLGMIANLLNNYIGPNEVINMNRPAQAMEYIKPIKRSEMDNN